MMKAHPTHGIVEKLNGSDAASSLRFEGEVAALVSRGGWVVKQSDYFVDGQSGKSRETDVKAKNSVSFRELTRFTSVIVECKSAADYHLLFSARLSDHGLCMLPRWWIGDDDQFCPELIERLRLRGLKDKQAKKIVRWMRQQNYTKDHAYRIGPVSLSTLPATATFAAFRETNVGTTRELESAVLWKASQQLRAAAVAELRWVRGATFDSFEAHVHGARRITAADMQFFSEEISMQARWLHCVHPVLVIESHLWEVLPGNVRPLDWCRVFVGDDHDDEMPWIDVVSRRHAPGYFATLQAHCETRDGQSRKARTAG